MTEYFKEETDGDFDDKFDSHKTDNQRKIERDFLDGIVEEAAKLKGGFLLDIASGRGLLLREILKNVDTNVEIISADLSFRV